MTDIAFIKMNGLGNDFVIVDARSKQYSFTESQIQSICDRSEGVGCDQFIVIEKSKRSDCFVRFYNADGSESGACGNGTRCVAKLMMDELGKDDVVLETGEGRLIPRQLQCVRYGEDISVNMGMAKRDWQDIPLARAVDTLHVGISAGELQDPVCVNMGNPHAVFFVDNLEEIDLANLGPQLENHEIFPERANIGIVQVLANDEIKLKVWERGAGETLACGSGACAAVVAANARNLTGDDVTVHLPGGDLHIELRNGEVIMTGPVQEEFRGEI